MILNSISVSDSASELEMLAVRTLQDYCRQTIGAEIPLISCHDLETDADGAVLIGLPSTNPQIDALVRPRKIRNPERNLKPEGFIIETLIDGGLSKLVITGRDPKGVLNGVYHLLREIFGVGFFGDGRQVPKRDSLTVPELSIASSPKFNNQ